MKALESEEAQRMMTPEMVQVVYYMRAQDDPSMRITFPQLGRFLQSNCLNNPLFASFIDEGMRDQIGLLNKMLDMMEDESEEEPEPTPVVSKPKPQEPKAEVEEEEEEDDTPVIRDTTPLSPLASHTAPLHVSESEATMPEIDMSRIAVIPFIQRFYAHNPTPQVLELRSLTDTITIRMPMAVPEMAAYIGSTPTQTRLVYGYAPRGTKRMTPLQYVHLLVDDLFQRPGLQGMISVEQRTMLEQRVYLMDLADRNARITPGEMNNMLRAFGITGYTNEQLLTIAYPQRAAKPAEQIAKTEPTQTVAPVDTISTPTVTETASEPTEIAEATVEPTPLNDWTARRPDDLVQPRAVRTVSVAILVLHVQPTQRMRTVARNFESFCRPRSVAHQATLLDAIDAERQPVPHNLLDDLTLDLAGERYRPCARNYRLQTACLAVRDGSAPQRIAILRDALHARPCCVAARRKRLLRPVQVLPECPRQTRHSCGCHLAVEVVVTHGNGLDGCAPHNLKRFIIKRR